MSYRRGGAENADIQGECAKVKISKALQSMEPG